MRKLLDQNFTGEPGVCKQCECSLTVNMDGLCRFCHIDFDLYKAQMKKIYLMNFETGSVDSLESWKEEMACWEDIKGLSPQAQFDALVPVTLESGEDVPDNFKSCNSENYNWIEG